MGQTDWQILTSGTGYVQNSRQDNAVVPDDQLTHDVNCRKIYGDRGHWVFRYISEEFASFQDLSIRAAISIKKTDALVHSAGIGLKIDTGVFSTPLTGDILDRFCENGYQLMIYDDFSLNLHRLKNNVQTQLFDIPLAGGTLGQFKWFHLRLDFLNQSDGRAVLHVYTNDVALNGITNPLWVKISGDIVENKTGIPETDKVGFGGLVDAAESTYIDRVEIYKS